jgi:hypothetical protein
MKRPNTTSYSIGWNRNRTVVNVVIDYRAHIVSFVKYSMYTILEILHA